MKRELNVSVGVMFYVLSPHPKALVASSAPDPDPDPEASAVAGPDRDVAGCLKEVDAELGVELDELGVNEIVRGIALGAP